MTISPHILFDQTDSLRADWSYLDQWGLAAKKINKRSAVYKRIIPGKDPVTPVYVKVYTYKKHPLQRYLRQGRSRIESRNLLLFQSLDIPTAPVVAWGSRRNAIGRTIEEFIVTESIEDAIPLDTFIEEHCSDPTKSEHLVCREQIINQVALATRTIHAANFIHHDLKWRNLLCRFEQGLPKVYWIDCPTGGFSKLKFRHQRGRRKDCATLDKLARRLCTKDERLQFIATYLGLPVDASEVATWAKNVSQYRQERFDIEDDKQHMERLSKT